MIDSNVSKSYISDVPDHVRREESKMLSVSKDLEKTPIFKYGITSTFSIPRIVRKTCTDTDSSAKSQTTDQESESLIKHKSY